MEITRDSKGRFVKGIIPKNAWKKGYISPNKGIKLSEKRKKEISILTKQGMIRAKMEGKQIGRKKGSTSWSYLDGRSKHPISRPQIKRKQIAYIVWCSQEDNFYRVPKGCVIHHLDLNPLNNKSINLQILEDKYHRSLHNKLFKLMKAGDIVSAI